MPRRRLHLRRLLLAAVLPAAAALCVTPADGLAASQGTHLADNCAPAAAADDGTMVFNRRENGNGDFDAYVGNSRCNGQRLLPPYKGNRGASDMTRDGRFVIITTAVGWDKSTVGSQPGKGSQNAIQVVDRRAGTVKTVVPSACRGCQRGTLWPRLSPDGSKLTWAEMVRSPWEAPMTGQWRLHVANIDLAAGTLSNLRSYEDPTTTAPAIYEPYGWMPGTNDIVFMTTSRMEGFFTQRMQLFTLPDSLPRQAPKRISPQMKPSYNWQRPTNAYHEFASFRPDRPHKLYTSVGTNTVGGADLFAYDTRKAGRDGLLDQPRRVSFFGGDMNRDMGRAPVPGYPQPRLAFVGGMAWVDGAWSAGVCRDHNCQQLDAWRITDPDAAG